MTKTLSERCHEGGRARVGWQEFRQMMGWEMLDRLRVPWDASLIGLEPLSPLGEELLGRNRKGRKRK